MEIYEGADLPADPDPAHDPKPFGPLGEAPFEPLPEPDPYGLDEPIPGPEPWPDPEPFPVPEPVAVDERPHFDPDSFAGEMAGNPAADLPNWHVQETGYTCAVAAQEFVLDNLTGQDWTEAELAEEARQHGWLDNGTAPDDMGKLLELHGIGVDRSYGNDIDDLIRELDAGHKINVAVDADEIWEQGEHFGDDLFDPGIPGMDANHAVQVIGVDTTDPDNAMVILNDSGDPNGQGVMIPAGEFMDAWADSDHYMVATTGEPPATPPDALFALAAA